MCARLGKV
jgi:hypothetical protein